MLVVYKYTRTHFSLHVVREGRGDGEMKNSVAKLSCRLSCHFGRGVRPLQYDRVL